MASTYEELVAKHGHIEGYCGVNEDKENVVVSIDDECATIVTFQKNGFIRTNIYHKDGTNEELYSH
jgi:hypothetical protein